MAVSSCHAQGGRRDIDDSTLFVQHDTSYSFIRYDENHLIIYGDTSAFQRFTDKWFDVMTTGKGHVNIMHIGGSHVQAGTLPHRIRRNILLGAMRTARTETSPIADRGFIFPYSTADKCNNPYDYRVSRNRVLALTRNVYKEPAEQLGLCGIAVTASDTFADIGITLNEPSIDFATNRITVIGHSRGGVTPQIRIGEEGNEPLYPIATDSIKERWLFEVAEPIDSFHLLLPCDSNQSFAVTGLYLSGRKSGVSYHSIGVNGAALGDYLDKCPNLTRDLRMAPPDLVIFGIGINDASGPNFDSAVFTRRYLQLVDSIRSISPDCAFIFITNNDSRRLAGRRRVLNTNGPLAREGAMRAAQKCGGAVWDQYAIMGGLRSMEKWHANQLAQRDHVHFTRKGYELIGDMISNALFETMLTLKRNTRETTTQVEQPSTTTTPKGAVPIYKPRNKKNDNRGNERPSYIYY